MKKYLFLFSTVVMLCGCESLHNKHNLTWAIGPWGTSYYSYSNMETQTAMVKNNLINRQQQYINSNLQVDNKVDKLVMKKLAYLNLWLEHSGFYNLQKIEECSNKLDENSFRNEILVKFNKNSEKGFAELLLDSPNQNLTNELSIITDNTLFCCNLQIKLKDFLAKYPKTAEYNDLNNILKKENIINLTLEQLAESSDGNWGILLNDIPQGKDINLEFSISIPDVNNTLFAAICERIVNNRLGKLASGNPDKLEIYPWKDFTPVIIKKNGYIVIYSSEQAIENIVKNVKVGEYSSALQKLNVPEKVVGNGFVYWKPAMFYWMLEFISSEPTLLLPGQNFECLNIIRNQNRSVLLTQYANIDLNDLHANKIVMVFSKVLETMLNPEILEIRNQEMKIASTDNCKKTLEELYNNKILPFMNANNGKLPTEEELGEKFNADLWCYINLDINGDSKTLPLIFDRQNNHGDTINVLFRDGSIITFEIENVSSAKKVLSFLHSTYRYKAQVFAELLKAVK